MLNTNRKKKISCEYDINSVNNPAVKWSLVPSSYAHDILFPHGMLGNKSY